MGLRIYIACDEEEKAEVHAEETENRTILKGSGDDPQRIELVKQIIMGTVHETPSETYREKEAC